MRSPLGRLAALLALSVVLTGCASAAEVASGGPSPTPSATTSAPPEQVLLDLACDDLLDAQDLSSLMGGEVRPLPIVGAEDPAVVGGLRCRWWGQGIGAIYIGAFPADAAPPQYGAEGEACGTYDFGCHVWRTVGETWVDIDGPSAEVAEQVISRLSPILEGRSAPTATPVEEAWELPACDEIKVVVQNSIPQVDLGDYSGDDMPAGPTWDLLTAQGAAQWCGWHGVGTGGYADKVEVFLGPGSGDAAAAAIAEGWQQTAIAGAGAVAFMSAEPPSSSRMIATVGQNSIEVVTRFSDFAQQVALVEALIDFMTVGSSSTP